MSNPQPAANASSGDDLEQAFGVFNELSERLTAAYGQLEGQVATLSDELARSRRQRQHERAQKEHLADQLGVLLEALPAAVVLVDVRDRIDRFNPAAEALFPSLSWGRRWSEVCAEVVASESPTGDWALRDGRRVNVSRRPLNDRGQILVVVDMTEQHRLQERVERQDRLSAMGEMAAQLAHQIRTPLSSAVLYAGQVAKPTLTDEQRRQFGEKLMDGLRHTETLVREMLAFSRGGNFTARVMPISLALDTAIASLQPRLRQLRGGLQWDDRQAAGLMVSGNADALAGAFANLIDNAINQGGEDVTISIACDRRADHLQICFDDDGPGVEPSLAARIFDPFFTTRERGTGLGLAVVQAVILEHGGSVRAGKAPSGGARFEIQLPLIDVAGQQSDQGTTVR
jgi:two-component system sensor histidine kinase FlrB